MCSVTNIVQTRQRCNLVLLVDWLTGCGSPRVLRSWLLVVHAIANKYAYTRCGTHKKNTFNSQFSRINTQTTRRVRIGIRFQFQFQRSTDTLVHFLVRVLSLITSGPFLFFGGSVLQIDCKLFLRGIF